MIKYTDPKDGLIIDHRTSHIKPKKYKIDFNAVRLPLWNNHYCRLVAVSIDSEYVSFWRKIVGARNNIKQSFTAYREYRNTINLLEPIKTRFEMTDLEKLKQYLDDIGVKHKDFEWHDSFNEDGSAKD